MKFKFSILTPLIFFSLALLISTAHAQDGRQLEKFREKIKEIRMYKLTERLKLTEDQSVRFFPKYIKYQDEQAANLQRGRQLFEDLDQLRSGNGTDSEIDKTISQILDVQRTTGDILSKYIKDFKEVLTMRQVAELVIFERDFLRDLNQLINEARKNAPRGRGAIR